MPLEKYRLVLRVIWLSSGDWSKAFECESFSSENRTETELHWPTQTIKKIGFCTKLHFAIKVSLPYSRRNASRVSNALIPHGDIYSLIVFLNSLNFDVNILSRVGKEIRLCVCVHMHSESLYAELTGNIAKTCRYTANNAKRWLQIHPPIHPSPPKDVSSLAFCAETAKTSAQKQMIPRTKSKVFCFVFSAKFAWSLMLSLQPSDSSLGTN